MKIKQKMNTSKNTVGMTLQAFLAGLLCFSLGTTAYAMESASYNLDADTPTHDEHAAGESNSFQLTGGITWRQTALTSGSFRIQPDPAAAQVTNPSDTNPSQPANPSPTAPIGGHRGSSASVAPVGQTSSASLHPAASSKRSVVRPRSSVASVTQTSSASSLASVTSGASASSVEATIIVDTTHPAAGCPPDSHNAAVDICRILFTNIASGSSIASFDSWRFFSLGFLLGLLTGLCAYKMYGSRKRTVLLPFMVGDVSSAKTKKRKAKTGTKKNKVVVHAVLFLSLAAASVAFSINRTAEAAISVPQRYVYNGHLLNSSGQPITTAHSIRFSFWKSADLDPADIVAGAIDTGVATYGGWEEVDTVTPDANGYFSVQLGALSALPDLSTYTQAELQNLFLQVEVKAQAAGDTSYEVLDVDPADPIVDRSPIESVPFAQNADTIDQREIGTGSGSIPLLGPGGKLPSSAIPSELQGVSLILDSTNTATGSISLQFGQALAKTLSYDTVNDRFNFNDSVQIQGNLTVLGLINGVDVTNLGSATGALRVFSGGGLNIKVAGGSYRLAGTNVNYAGGMSAVAPNTTNYVFLGSGGLAVRTMPFPTDESFIPLAEVVTGGGAVNYILDRRQLMSDDREELVEQTLHPAYPDASYTADGSDNVGQLSVSNDPVTLKNGYVWTSTRSTLQDYDVLLRVTLPSQFVHWKASPLTFLYKSSSADTSISKMDLQVYDTAGNPVTLTGTSTNLANTAWTSQSVDFAGTPTWTPGGTVVVRFRLSAKDNAQMLLGDLGLQYVKLTGN